MKKLRKRIKKRLKSRIVIKEELQKTKFSSIEGYENWSRTFERNAEQIKELKWILEQMPQYNKVKKQFYNGHKFDSKAEMNYYKYYLVPALDADLILDLRVHPRFVLQESFKIDGETIRAITWTADFQYWDCENKEIVVVDVKGHETGVFKLKKKMFQKRFFKHKLVIVPAKDWSTF